jgi:HD superfamily phosphohydrolase YqeK
MTIQDYAKDKQLVIQLHDMARHYDSEFLRNVADRMDFMIEENRKHDREQLSES